MPCFVHCFPVSTVQKLLKSVRLSFHRVAVKCILLRFMNQDKYVGFFAGKVRT